MYEEWDEVIYGTKDEPLTWLFEEPLCLPKPDDVGDETHAWQVLSALLTAMALRGVAFDMCPHFTAMQAYRLLINELLPKGRRASKPGRHRLCETLLLKRALYRLLCGNVMQSPAVKDSCACVHWMVR